MGTVRTSMREDEAKAANAKQLSERKEKGNQLIEAWAKRKDVVGEKFLESAQKAPEKFRNLAVMLENFEGHVSNLTEAQTSAAFKGVLPTTIAKIVRLGYPNSVRGDIFHEWAMQSADDSIYYWSPIYATTKRDGVAGTITHQTATNRYSSEMTVDAIAATAATDNYTGTLSVVPVRSYKVTMLIDNVPVGNDDGAGNISGAIPTTLGYGALTITGTINYTTGAYDVTFSATPTGAKFDIEFLYDMEVEANYDEQGELHWELTRKQFKPDFHSLKTAWSLKSELILQKSMNIDLEDSMVNGAVDELKKSLDFRALSLGANVSKKNAITTFDADWKTSGSNSPKSHAQGANNAIKRAGSAIFSELQRGAINVIYGGEGAIDYLSSYIDNFREDDSQEQIGAHLVGYMGKVPVYKVPSTLVGGSGEVIGVFNNNSKDDYAISTGVLVPIAANTEKLTFASLNSEMGTYCVEDTVITQDKYIRILELTALPED